MKLRRANACCGCASLLVGVEACCALTLLWALCAIDLASSAKNSRIFGLTITPWVQVLWGSWGFVGIPVAIVAGVCAMHRVAQGIRIFVGYLLLSLVLAAAFVVWILVSGSTCDALLDPSIQRMGAAFVCGFTDTFLVMWALVLATVGLYLIYVVWSAAEEITHDPYPQLLKYRDRLRRTKGDEQPSGPYPLSVNRAEPIEGAYPPPPMLNREQRPGRPKSSDASESQVSSLQHPGEQQYNSGFAPKAFVVPRGSVRPSTDPSRPPGTATLSPRDASASPGAVPEADRESIREFLEHAPIGSTWRVPKGTITPTAPSVGQLSPVLAPPPTSELVGPPTTTRAQPGG